MKIKLLTLLIVFLSVISHRLHAEIRIVSATDDLQYILDNSANNDVIKLKAGRYVGNFVVPHKLTITSYDHDNKAVIDAKGHGHALNILHDGVVISHLNIVNWGDDLTSQDAGISAIKHSNNLIIKNNNLHGDGFGMWLQKGENIRVIGNVIQGNLALRSADRGNGIQLSSVKHALIKGNEVFHARDGIYIISSQHNVIDSNTMHDLRYGVHYMYSYNNDVLNNAAYNTRAGYALMSSRHLVVRGNSTKNSEDYGFLMNFITSSTIEGNHIEQVWTKPENKVLGRDGKGLFVYNSAYNTINNNVIDTAEIGIHLTAGSENTKVYGNSFINNPVQVKYVSNKKQEWSHEGKGNYWSNYLGWDMNGDSIGDVMFEPNDGIDKLTWQYPEMKMIMDSPVVLILRWVQREFPVLKPPGVKDSYPLMRASIEKKVIQSP